jgi:hypothetical protein
MPVSYALTDRHFPLRTLSLHGDCKVEISEAVIFRQWHIVLHFVFSKVYYCVLLQVAVPEALPLPPSRHEEQEKSPSPPLKKAKFIDETPKPVAPVFTVPLHDAAIQEGDRVTLECR